MPYTGSTTGIVDARSRRVNLEVKVRLVGNDLTLLLPDDVAAKLNDVDGGTLSLVLDGEAGYRLVPATARADIMAVYEASHEQFGSLYKKLAE